MAIKPQIYQDRLNMAYRWRQEQKARGATLTAVPILVTAALAPLRERRGRQVILNRSDDL
jgi:predicted component of type VI protein secretion system